MSPSAAPTASSVGAWNCTRKRFPDWYLPASSSRVAGRDLRSSHGWLKNVAFIVPVASATTASTSGFIPRRRTGREAIERTSTTTVAGSSPTRAAPRRALPRGERRDRARRRAGAGQVLEQVAHRVQPEPLGALRRLGGRDL